MTFNVMVQNIPIINLKREFFEFHELIHNEAFMKAAFNSAVTPVELPSMMWHGLPNDLLTLMTQRAIGGLESYVVAAAEYELCKRGAIADDVQRGLDNPFSLGKGAATVLYDRVPALVSEEFMLSKMNPELSKKTRDFYKQVRNPIFHGSQLVFNYESYPVLKDMFSHMRLLYSWIDEWYTCFQK